MNSRRQFLKTQVGVVSGVLFGNSALGFFSDGEVVTMNKEIQEIQLSESGHFPNSTLQLVVYKQAVKSDDLKGAADFENVFKQNGWGNNWRNGIYDYHHYHSVAHEFIGVYGGSAELQFGGPDGPVVKVTKGDALVIPAGVAHKRISSSFGFSVVGAYPTGQSPDMMYGKEAELVRAKENIARVRSPGKDPLFGEDGPLVELWKAD